MKRTNRKGTFWVVSLMTLVLLIGCNEQKSISKTGNNKQPVNRILIIGLDGFSVHGYETAKLPNIDRLMADGILSLDTRPVMPSVTLPNWTSHLTGSGPEQHGVDNNNWTLDSLVLPPVAMDAEGYYPSIFKVLKDTVPGMKTAYYYNWGNLINPINQKYLDEVNYLEDDKYLENYDRAFEFAKKHQDDPSLIFLYNVHTDHEGHTHGWTSPEYITALEDADKAIGTLIDKFKAEGLYGDTHFFLITDHGGKGKGHGGMTPLEMTVPWAVTGPGIQKGKKLEEPSNNTNTAAVILRLFGMQDKPKEWIGEVPESIFE